MRCFDDISLLTQEGSRELDLLYFLIKHPGASLKLKERCLMKRRCLSRRNYEPILILLYLKHKKCKWSGIETGFPYILTIKKVNEERGCLF